MIQCTGGCFAKMQKKLLIIYPNLHPVRNCKSRISCICILLDREVKGIAALHKEQIVAGGIDGLV
jgi:hypothetical protein